MLLKEFGGNLLTRSTPTSVSGNDVDILLLEKVGDNLPFYETLSDELM